MESPSQRLLRGKSIFFIRVKNTKIVLKLKFNVRVFIFKFNHFQCPVTYISWTKSAHNGYAHRLQCTRSD